MLPTLSPLSPATITLTSNNTTPSSPFELDKWGIRRELAKQAYMCLALIVPLEEFLRPLTSLIQAIARPRIV